MYIKLTNSMSKTEIINKEDIMRAVLVDDNKITIVFSGGREASYIADHARFESAIISTDAISDIS